MNATTGATGPPQPFLSSYYEVSGDSQTVEQNALFVFDIDSDDSEGNNMTISADGTTITINTPGLYNIQWDMNLAERPLGSEQVVVGILENGQPSSGASTSGYGNFSSGTTINVESTPFTISLYNYGPEVELVRHPQFEDSALSIRIIRFADGPST